MKKLFLLTFLCFVLSPANAQSINIVRGNKHPQLSDVLSEELARQSATAPTREEQIRKALADEVFISPKQKDWSYFLAQNQKVQQAEQADMENSLNLLYHQYDTDCLQFTKNLGRTLWGKFRLDYVKEAKGVKYIYVSDASDHQTKDIPTEVAYLLQQVRKANPDARILLATEFAVHTDSAKTPIRFAHDKNRPFQTIEQYAQLVTASDKNNIDILGLDDSLYSAEEAIKVGDIIIKTPFDNSQIQHILTQYNPDILPSYQNLQTMISEYTQSLQYCWNFPEDAAKQLNISLDKLPEVEQQYSTFLDACMISRSEHITYLQECMRDFLFRSDWGVLQRNRQWARYIKALSPFYDIIITYAGSAHLGEKGDTRNVPDLIGEEYVLFNFYTTEQLPEELQARSELVNKIQAQENTFVIPWENETLREDVLNKNDQVYDFWRYAGHRTPPNGKESNQYFFIQWKPMNFSAEEQQEIATQCNQFSVPPSSMQMKFDVFLATNETLLNDIIILNP
ncbi:hypothetical protein [Candidatus Avelusimicrobium luingense]|uniref:hypothetical protein n=1 Tax=Candidatus Avelusimicrobium luingense TaxID=3416211 RepID=UPI003D0B82D5